MARRGCRRRASRDTATRWVCHRRRRADLRPLLRPEPARERALHGACRPAASCSASRRARATWPCCSARPRGATASGVSVLASAGFSGEQDDTKRPSVQVGDPFEEKRLIEACLELLDTKLVVGIQDLGGAGLACATSEDGGARRRRHGRGRLRRARGAGGHGALGGDDEREPGTHARHRDPGVVAGRGRHLRQVGGASDRHRHRHRARSSRRRSPAHPPGHGRTGAGRRAGVLPLRRRPALRPPAAGAGPRPCRRAAAAGTARRRRVRRRPVGAAALGTLGVAAVRPPAVPEHGCRPRRGRRAAAAGRPGAAPVRARRGHHDRLQPAGLRARPSGRAPRSCSPRPWRTSPASVRRPSRW